jgi:transmembrane sensor
VFEKRRASEETGSDPVLRAAAQWLARADLGTLDEAAFERWRTEDPRHALAFIRVSDAARRAAADGAEAPAVKRSRKVDPTRRGAIAAGLAVFSLGGGALIAGKVNARDRASTPVGGMRHVDLAGAGGLTLNTDSAASWKSGHEGLRLWLERGEIALDIAANARPVHLKGGPVGARLGPGRYNARLREGLLDLVVLKGEASAEGISASPSATPVRGPTALALTPERPLARPLSEQDIAAVLAWRSGEILFVDEPLSSAIEEYNRHLVRKIVLADPQLAGLRVGGRFVADDPSAFLLALETTMNVRVTPSQQVMLLSLKNS